MHRCLLPCLALLLAAPAANAADSKYQDNPMELTEKGVAIVAGYARQDLAQLDEFDDSLSKTEAGTHFVITRIHQAGHFEQIYVRVQARTETGYRGTITSKPVGPIKYEQNAPIEVAREDVVDWCINLPSGEERGNLTGKAMDALMAGQLACIIEMKPTNGTFESFAVVSVMNPKTRQEVIELVPPDVRQRVSQAAGKLWRGTKAEGADPRYQYIIVSFPTWDIKKR